MLILTKTTHMPNFKKLKKWNRSVPDLFPRNLVAKRMGEGGQDDIISQSDKLNKLNYMKIMTLVWYEPMTIRILARIANYSATVAFRPF